MEFGVENGHVERSFDLSVLGGVALLRSSRLRQAFFFVKNNILKIS